MSVTIPGCCQKQNAWLWVIAALVVFNLPALSTASGRNSRQISRRSYFTNCGGFINGTFGYLTTPNFPGPFPVPIRCRWVIEAPPGKAIAVYFTQFYLREGFRGGEYADYTHQLGRKDFGVISFDNRTTYLTTLKPVLVLDLAIDEMSNVNMRVMDFFLDVYGFNITYEIISRGAAARRDACSVFHCSFNGHCFAGPQFTKYKCHCFPGFYGEACQFGPHCDPHRNVSLCQPGRQCRYIIGSQLFICDCPPGYIGEKCESNACKTLNCSQLCIPIPNGSGHQCSCYAGYKLHSDNRTCISHGRIRYLGSFKLKEPSFDPTTANKSSSDYVQLKRKIILELNTVLRKKVDEIRNLTVLDFHPGGVVEFHFFGNPKDSDVARKILMDSVAKGLIGKLPVVSDYIRFEREPALNLQKVFAKQGPIRLQGRDVSFSCVVMGTSSLQFRWLKDGFPINNFLSNHHVWVGSVPKNTHDQYTGLLMIDQLLPQDSGTFTCQVSDWGEVQEKSVSFSVMTPPRVNLVPLTATVNENESLTIMCQSEEDADGSFGYSWIKNGDILNPSEGHEIMEDLFPTGSRIKILQATSSATYTCIVNNWAGQTRLESHVTVINPDYPVCNQLEELNVTWHRTAANSEDIRPCPTNYKGNAHRACGVVARTPKWEEGDYSNCTANEIASAVKSFENLKLGYMVTNTSTILRQVLSFVISRAHSMYPGEGKPILDLLDQIYKYHQNYLPKPKKLYLSNLQVMLDIIALLLNSSRSITKPQHAVQLQVGLQKLSHSLASLTDNNSTRTEFREPFLLEVAKVPSSNRRTLMFPSSVKSSLTNQLSTWMTDYIIVTVDAQQGQRKNANATVEIAVIFYKNLSSLLPKRYLATKKNGLQMDYYVHSNIIALSTTSIDGKPGRVINGSTKVTLAFDRKDEQEKPLLNNTSNWNITCGRADFQQIHPKWVLSACSMVTNDNATFCHCNDAGVYALLLTSYNLPKEEHFELGFDSAVSICCFLCLVFLLLSIFYLTILWRNSQCGILMLKLQVCFGVAGIVASFLGASTTSINPDFYPYIATTLEFFSLLPYSTQVCLELIIYLAITHSYQVQNAKTKIVLISWGIPTLVTGATLAAQSQTGFKFVVWWIQIGDVYFYGFVITTVILTLLYVALYLIVSAELRHVKDDELAKGMFTFRRGRQILQRSLIVQFFLIILTIAGVFYVNNNDDLPSRYFFSASTAIMGLTILLFYGLDSRLLPPCIHNLNRGIGETSDSPSKSESLRAFIKIYPDNKHLDNNVCNSSLERKKQKQKMKMKLQLANDQKQIHRDMEDLLPDVTSNQKTRCNRYESPEALKKEVSSHLESGDSNDNSKLDIGPKNDHRDKTSTRINSHGEGALPTSVTCKNGIRDQNIHLVSYDGSPKKFYINHNSLKNKMGAIPEPIPEDDGEVEASELDNTERTAGLGPQFLKPDPGHCYILDTSPTGSPVLPRSPQFSLPCPSFR